MKRFIALFCFLLLFTHQAAGQTATPTHTPPPLGDSDFVDDPAPAIDFVDHPPLGAYWSTVIATAAYWGSYHKASDRDTLVLPMRFNFVGDRVTLYAITTSSGDADATLLIDGVEYPVSFYSTTTLYQQVVIEITGLDYGWHQGQLNGSGTGSIYVDAIHIGPYETSAATQAIYLTLIAEIIQESTAEPTPGWRSGYEIDGQAVAFEYNANAGQAAGIVFKAGILLVAILVAVVLTRGGEL